MLNVFFKFSGLKRFFLVKWFKIRFYLKCCTKKKTLLKNFFLVLKSLILNSLICENISKAVIPYSLIIGFRCMMSICSYDCSGFDGVERNFMIEKKRGRIGDIFYCNNEV